jgi:replicative DNA helicase
MNLLDIKNSSIEQAILGMILFDNNTYDLIADIIQIEFFTETLHQEIYKHTIHLLRQGKVANPLTLIGFFCGEQSSKSPEMIYMIQLVENVTSVSYIEQYSVLLRDMYIKRQLLNVSQEIQDKIFSLTSQEIIDKMENNLFLLNSKTQRNQMMMFFEAAHNVVTKISMNIETDRQVVGTTSGFHGLDKLLGGFHPGELVIIAGRPSMGKTALAASIGFNAARDIKHGGPVAFFSLEMPYEQIILRLLSSEIGISAFDLRSGKLPFGTINDLSNAYQKLADLKFFIDDTPNITVSGIRSKARTIKRKHGLALIVIDYLQLISPKDSHRSDTRTQEVGFITQSLKAIAKELSVSVIALSQLSRSVEQRGEDHRPQMSDLRESGEIEQHADVVSFVYREEYYLRRKEPKTNDNVWLEWKKKLDTWENIAEVLIDKNRNGSIGSVKMGFEGRLTRFSNLEEKE